VDPVLHVPNRAALVTNCQSRNPPIPPPSDKHPDLVGRLPRGGIAVARIFDYRQLIPLGTFS
jgi:hypothetical protein